MELLILAEDFYPKESGGAFIDWNVAKHIAEAGESVTVVTPRTGEVPSQELVDGIDIRRPFRGAPSEIHPNSLKGQLWRIIFVLAVVPYLIHLGVRTDFDVVYSTNHVVHLPASIFSRIHDVPHLSFVGYSPSIRDDISIYNPLMVLERVNFRYFMGDRVICRTPSIYEKLSELTNADVVRVDGIVDTGALERAIEVEPGIEPNIGGEIQLVFVGRLVDIKNPDYLPHLVNQLPPEYSLLIVGDGPHRDSVEKAIQEVGVEERVDMVGRLPHERALRAIYDSDILVLPSDTESYGAVVFESLSLNTPVVATPVGVLPSVDHPGLSVAPLHQFDEALLNIEPNSEQGIDRETLRQFSVDQFSRDVYENILKTI